ncbi:uncharacterized protein EV420DRAFT_1487807 [Desarmillaria tabescens]|uniref:Uncharacterized protein n=1 Tax=Armillaria tabescens TaxID=1929756 RepID=A0AA39J7Z7_ARMTA|nr:uncharacterized protein EV420DRAFT_1487807 [Desarmillaria tabescens]KAK0435928.1 hypothetical protein EV420DRAFT_1487807 [Desarmillaria tabescens]
MCSSFIEVLLSNQEKIRATIVEFQCWVLSILILVQTIHDHKETNGGEDKADCDHCLICIDCQGSTKVMTIRTHDNWCSLYQQKKHHASKKCNINFPGQLVYLFAMGYSIKYHKNGIRRLCINSGMFLADRTCTRNLLLASKDGMFSLWRTSVPDLYIQVLAAPYWGKTFEMILVLRRSIAADLSRRHAQNISLNDRENHCWTAAPTRSPEEPLLPPQKRTRDGETCPANTTLPYFGREDDWELKI